VVEDYLDMIIGNFMIEKSKKTEIKIEAETETVKTVNKSAKFGLIIPKEEMERFNKVAIEATNFENHIWDILRKYDPADYLVMHNQKRGEDKKFPPLPKYNLSNYEEYIGKDFKEIAKELCEIIGSGIYGTITREVGNEYYKNRLDILRHKRTISIVRKPRIRFRNSNIKIIKKDDGFYIELRLFKIIDRKKQSPIIAKLYTKRQGKDVLQFLEESSKSNMGPCGGKIFKQDGRWKITLCRKEEIKEAKELNNNCYAVVYAEDYSENKNGLDSFLKIKIFDKEEEEKGWTFDIPSSGYIETIKRSYIRELRQRGKNFSTSNEIIAAKGHGRDRANLSRLPKKKKHLLDKNYIENKTREIIDRITKDGACKHLFIEDLVEKNKRSPNSMAFFKMDFPYYKMVKRLKEKSKAEGISCHTVPPNGGIEDWSYLKKRIKD
jgi:hypothetical protein